MKNTGRIALILYGLVVGEAASQAALRYFGDWGAGLSVVNGQTICTAMTVSNPIAQGQLFQIIRMRVEGHPIIGLNFIFEGQNFAGVIPISLLVGGRQFAFQARPVGSRGGLAVFSQNQAEVRIINEAVIAMTQAQMPIFVVFRPANNIPEAIFSVSGIQAAIQEMNACAVREGMLDRRP